MGRLRTWLVPVGVAAIVTAIIVTAVTLAGHPGSVPAPGKSPAQAPASAGPGITSLAGVPSDPGTRTPPPPFYVTIVGMQPDHNVATRYGYDRIDAVDVPDPQTAVVRFKVPFAPWATLFDVVLPKHILAQQADFNGSPYHQKPVGFGPFKVAENIKGDHTTYEAFDGYWRARPKVDRLFIRYFGNTDAELQALKAKEIDLAWGVPLSSIPELQGLESQGITTLVQPGPAQERYTFNM